MKTLRKVPVESFFVEHVPDIEDMDEGRVYISERFSTSTHRCLCGCGLSVVLPFGEGQWEFDDSNGLTIKPSVGNFQFPCKSHYIITKGVANFV